MTLEPNILASKSSNIYHMEKIGLFWLNCNGEVLCVVEERSLWNWFGTSWVGFADKLRDKDLHLLMIPIGDR